MLGMMRIAQVPEALSSPNAPAVTESGTKLHGRTDADIDTALTRLILSGGGLKKTAKALCEDGLEVTHEQLRYWRNHAFARRYYELRQKLARDVGEELAGRGLERALQADDAERALIEKTIEKLDEIPPQALAGSVRNLAQAKAANIEKAQLLRDRPTEIRETRSVTELVAVLARAGVIDVDEQAISADVIEQGPLSNRLQAEEKDVDS